MRRYIIRRLLIAVVIIFGVSVVTFTFANLAPGDPISAMVRPGSDLKPADLEPLKKQLGLDKPWHERYLAWAGQILQGNLGVSFIGSQPIARLLGDRIPNSDQAHGHRAPHRCVPGDRPGHLFGVQPGHQDRQRPDHVVFAGISLPSYLIALLALILSPSCRSASRGSSCCRRAACRIRPRSRRRASISVAY